MFRQLAVSEMRRIAITIALICALNCAGGSAAAQNACRAEDEVFGGYAFLAPNGWGDLNYKINNIPNAFEVSNTYYFRKTPNFGLLIDGSGHFRGGTTPPNLENGSDNSTAAGYALGGLQYKFHGDKLSPFVRGFVGGANLSPDCCGGTQWNLAAGGGGGLDLRVTPRFSIRLAQVDYIYTNYNHRFVTDHPTQWNSLRVAAGVVFTLGNGSCSAAAVSCSVSATPSPVEVWAGEPVKLSAAGTNFNSKHAVNYGWTSSGGKLSSASTQATEIDTAGLAPGTYTVNATIVDPKVKQANSAMCSTSFIVKQPATPIPPVVSCAVSPPQIGVGESSTVTLTASSPDHRPLTYSWSTTGGQLNEQGGSAILTAYPADGGTTIAVTGTATDDRSLRSSSICKVPVKPPATEPCVKIEKWPEGCSFEAGSKRPWRVDNACKDILDKLATRLLQTPNETLAVVGHAGQKEAANDSIVGARRAMNAKYYLSTDGPTKIDPARIQSREGGTTDAVTDFYFIPEGKLCSGEMDKLGTAVDETEVQGQSRVLPHRSKKTAKPSAAVSPAQ
jgi:hypothetical protein